MEAIILAGGLGTRLEKIVSDVPKSMAMINDRPFLEYLLNYLSGQGITRIILSVGFRKEMISEHFGSTYKAMQLLYAEELEPLGTGGGIKNAFKYVERDFAIVLNGDSMFRIDLRAMMNRHIAAKAEITIALRYLEETERFGTVAFDTGYNITEFKEKNGEGGPGYINGGIYIINKSYIQAPHFLEKFSIEKDCFEKYLNQSRFFGYPTRGYFIDIGVPEDFYKAQNEFRPFED